MSYPINSELFVSGQNGYYRIRNNIDNAELLPFPSGVTMVWGTTKAQSGLYYLNAISSLNTNSGIFTTSDFATYTKLDYTPNFSTLNGRAMYNNNGTIWMIASASRAFSVYTTDGTNVNEVEVATTGTTFNSASLNNGVYFATAGNNRIWYSSDAANPGAFVQANPSSTYAINDVCYNPLTSQYYACEQHGAIYYSSDLSTWNTANNSSGRTETLYGITFGNGRMVIVGNQNLYSDDGINFTPITDTNLTARKWNKVVYTDGIFIACCSQSRIIAWSPNGIDSWTQEILPVSNVTSLVDISVIQ